MRLLFLLCCLLVLYFTVPVFFVTAGQMPLFLFLLCGGALAACMALALYALSRLHR